MSSIRLNFPYTTLGEACNEILVEVKQFEFVSGLFQIMQIFNVVSISLNLLSSLRPIVTLNSHKTLHFANDQSQELRDRKKTATSF